MYYLEIFKVTVLSFVHNTMLLKLLTYKYNDERKQINQFSRNV